MAVMASMALNCHPLICYLLSNPFTMYILFTIFFILISSNPCVSNQNRDKIGTVLFSESDNLRTCWSDEHVAMLTSRMYFEDLLPANNMFNIQDDHFINALIEYFQMVTDTVKRSTEGKAKHVLLTSLCDCLGGYLHHTALPLGRHAFYSGNINYDSMERIYSLYEEIKEFLRTDGKAWAPPMTDFSQFKNKVLPLPIMAAEQANSLPCHDIIYYDNDEHGDTKLFIPLPFFDSNTNPHAIAVPYHNKSLRNVQGKSSAFIVVKYYTDAVKCFAHKKADNISLAKFYKDLDNWITSYVFPRTSDDRFYSAFGGIYRLRETLKKNMQILGVDKPGIGQYEIVKVDKEICTDPPNSIKQSTSKLGAKSRKRSVINNYDFMNDNDLSILDIRKKTLKNVAYFDEPAFWDEDLKKKKTTRNESLENSLWYNIKWDLHTASSIIMCNIFLIVILLWFCVGTLYLCYRMYRKKKGQPESEPIPESKPPKPKRKQLMKNFKFIKNKEKCENIEEIEQAVNQSLLNEICEENKKSVAPKTSKGSIKSKVTETFMNRVLPKVQKECKTAKPNKWHYGSLYGSNQCTDASCRAKMPKHEGPIVNRSFEERTSMCFYDDKQSRCSKKFHKPLVYGYEYYSTDSSVTDTSSSRIINTKPSNSVLKCTSELKSNRSSRK